MLTRRLAGPPPLPRPRAAPPREGPAVAADILLGEREEGQENGERIPGRVARANLHLHFFLLVAGHNVTQHRRRKMAATGAGAPSNFGRLLASSRFASHHPTSSQVYTASAAHLARGDFGVKRPLPTQHLPVGSIRYVDIANVDSRESQTKWSEREREVLLVKRFNEMNVRIRHTLPNGGGPARTAADLSSGALGPRLSTTYDPSTRRPVPTLYKNVEKEGLRRLLESRARQGRGPVYASEQLSTSSNLDPAGPFGKVSMAYSDTLPIDIDYSAMDEKTFEKYVGLIREQRPHFRKHLNRQAALLARRQVANEYERQRQALLEGKDGNGSDTIPPPVHESQLPLPEVEENLTGAPQEHSVDMWDSGREKKRRSLPDWRLWLSVREEAHSHEPNNSTILSNAAKNANGQRQPLHVRGGLQYSQPDSISTQLLGDKLPARFIDYYVDNERRRPNRMANRMHSNGYAVALAGRIATVTHGLSGSDGLIDWTQRRPESGTTFVKPLYVEAETTRQARDRQVLAMQERLEKPLPIQGARALNVQLRNVKNSSNQDGENRSRARGVPGTPQWIAEIEGRTGYARHDGPYDALDYASLSAMGGRSSASASSGLYSNKERRRAERQRGRNTNEQYINKYAALMERARGIKQSS